MTRPLGDEIERIRRVYAGYEADPSVAARWDTAAAGNRDNIAERDRILSGQLQPAGVSPLSDKRILEVGCGEGQGVSSLIAMGADPAGITAVDLRQSAVFAIEKRFPGVSAIFGELSQLRLPDASFDLVSLFTVFSSVSSEMQRLLATEVGRLLRPGGAVLWYDMRYPNPWNRNVHPVSRRKIATLFPGYAVHLRSLTLIPPLARTVRHAALVQACSRIPPLRSHLAGLIVKPQD